MSIPAIHKPVSLMLSLVEVELRISAYSLAPLAPATRNQRENYSKVVEVQCHKITINESMTDLRSLFNVTLLVTLFQSSFVG